MARSILMIGLALAIAVAGALAWPDRSGSVGMAPASRDAGVESGRAEHDEAKGALLVGISPEAAAPMRREPEEGEDDLAVHLPATSPKMVRFGVILVQYRGAEVVTPAPRSRQEAFALARSIAQAAKTDFKSQVEKGDPGSMDDAGSIPRGVLEPAVEYALFTLKAGEVSDPIDTPRGFWIVRRIE
jgi:hypothetical protein